MSTLDLTNDSVCNAPPTKLDKSWPYEEYYEGERDAVERKNGNGTNHWIGAESMEWYTGRLLRDTMHGIGEYRCRHREESDADITYEGYFYNNYMHGYGVTSYPDGNVFCGIFHSNFRYGPGVKSEARLREDVGFWKGTQLVRLSWRPSTPSVVPDILSTKVGREIVKQNRSVLVVKKRIIGETNPALELLKQNGADPLTAAQNWSKLYPKNCTDENSQLFCKDIFDRAYYDNEIESLEDYNTFKQEKEDVNQMRDANSDSSHQTYYAWNNNKMVINMMKHCYQHDKQRRPPKLNLEALLNGPRILFKPAADHELDCRSLLMSSYLGDIIQVAHLINEYGVNPNVTDMQGNSAVMYAACGNQPVVLHFLVDAGAQINDYNDACFTPLGALLIIYACTHFDIQPCNIINSILPSSFNADVDPEVMVPQNLDWKIERDLSAVPLPKKDPSPELLKKSTIESLPKKPETPTQDQTRNIFNKEMENPIYKNLFNVFKIKVDDLFTPPKVSVPVHYIFQVNDMVEAINQSNVEAEPKKDIKDKKETKKNVSKTKGLKKSSMDLNLYLQSPSEDLRNQLKDNEIKSMKSTITQLLLDGADPRRVHCPQPALFLAVISQDVDLIETLVKHGANVNEVYPGTLGYTPIDIAVSGSLTYQNLEVIRTLLKVGAKPNHRIPINIPNINEEEGPTLLHAVLAKEQNAEDTEEIRLQVLELLLANGCDPLAQYNGRSSMHVVLSRSSDIFDVFIESPNTDLNGVINMFNQTLLIKMFHLSYCRTLSIAERLQKLTNLLLFGADPLLKCQNELIEYDNLFVYAKNNLMELEKLKTPAPTPPGPSKQRSFIDAKGKIDKSKNAVTKPSNIAGKGLTNEDIADYKQALNLVTNCARLLFIRWIQAKLMKELVTFVARLKHRHWNMILKEYKNGKRLGLWLTPVRCLEIWDILKTTNKQIYNDRIIRKHVLCIVVFHFKNTKKILRWSVSSEDKASIELEVAYFIREHNMVGKVEDLKRQYVAPELTPTKEIGKFNICFECALPLREGNILCIKCKLVSFCSFECLKINVERDNCHPCSAFLQSKYFPPSSSELSESALNV